ncbi:MAG: hypothetical protein ACKVHB_06280, partial [Pseudomonadales bacterium]
MSGKRNAIKYNSVGIFLTDSPAAKPGADVLYFFNRVQSASVSVDVSRQDVQHIGSEDFLDRKIVSELSTKLSLEYLLTDGYEESLLGLNILSKGQEMPSSTLCWREDLNGNLVLLENEGIDYLPAPQLFEDSLPGCYAPRNVRFLSNTQAAQFFEKNGESIKPTETSTKNYKANQGRSAYY